jgi:hypothetical protein
MTQKYQYPFPYGYKKHNRITFRAGLGCHDCDNCFTCPYPNDCRAKNKDIKINNTYCSKEKERMAIIAMDY